MPITDYSTRVDEKPSIKLEDGQITQTKWRGGQIHDQVYQKIVHNA